MVSGLLTEFTQFGTDNGRARHKRSVDHRGRMDETYIKVMEQWKYLYLAVDTAGQTTTPANRQKGYRSCIMLLSQGHSSSRASTWMVVVDKRGANTAALAAQRRQTWRRKHHHPVGDGLSPAEQCYLLVAWKTGRATFSTHTLLLQHTPYSWGT